MADFEAGQAGNVDEFEEFDSGKGPSPGATEHTAAGGGSCNRPYGGVCGAGQVVEDAVLSFLPEEVTRHLVNAKQEAIRGAMRLGELAIECLERRAQRAAELHRK